MEVQLTADQEAQLNALAQTTGRGADELVQDALAAYFSEVAEVRIMLDGRYDEVATGRVEPLDGEAVFERLRRKREEWRLERQ